MRKLKGYLMSFLIIFSILTAIQIPITPVHAVYPPDESFPWDFLVRNATYQWNSYVKLRDEYASSAGNLTFQYDSQTGVSSNLYNHMLKEALAMYLMTGNTTYLSYARSVADDIQTYMFNSSTHMLCKYINGTGRDNSSANAMNISQLKNIAHLASLDSSYVPFMESVIHGILQHFLSAHNLVYTSVKQNGTVGNNDQHFPRRVDWLLDGLMSAYQVNGNTTYLETVGKIIDATWALRNVDTNLFPDKVDADSKAVVEDFQREYSVASFIRCLLFYYYLTGNETIKTRAIDYADGVYEYVWDGNDWDYRTRTDGSTVHSVVETMSPSLDWSMILMTDLTGNTSYRDRGFSDLDRIFFVKGLSTHDASMRVYHAVTDAGTPSSLESLSTGYFDVSSGSTMRYHRYADNDTFLDMYWEHYEGTTDGHHRATYGYQSAIVCENGSDTSYSYKRSTSFASIISNWAQYLIRPSSSVNITWYEINNENMYEPWSSIAYDYHGWYDKVHFNHELRRITLDEVSGDGTINFTEPIILVYMDGSNYTDFSGSAMNTTSGTHSYIIYFGMHAGDVDGDGDVDRYDYGLLTQAYGTSVGDQKYDPNCDFDKDGDVDRYDYGILAQNYGVVDP